MGSPLQAFSSSSGRCLSLEIFLFPIQRFQNPYKCLSNEDTSRDLNQCMYSSVLYRQFRSAKQKLSRDLLVLHRQSRYLSLLLVCPRRPPSLTQIVQVFAYPITPVQVFSTSPSVQTMAIIRQEYSGSCLSNRNILGSCKFYSRQVVHPAASCGQIVRSHVSPRQVIQPAVSSIQVVQASCLS